LNEKKQTFTRARQPDQIEERKAAILESALNLFIDKGLENVSLSDIASKIGCAKLDFEEMTRFLYSFQRCSALR
jgi:hypothetical protein